MKYAGYVISGWVITAAAVAWYWNAQRTALRKLSRREREREREQEREGTSEPAGEHRG